MKIPFENPLKKFSKKASPKEPETPSETNLSKDEYNELLSNLSESLFINIGTQNCHTKYNYDRFHYGPKSEDFKTCEKLNNDLKEKNKKIFKEHIDLIEKYKEKSSTEDKTYTKLYNELHNELKILSPKQGGKRRTKRRRQRSNKKRTNKRKKTKTRMKKRKTHKRKTIKRRRKR